MDNSRAVICGLCGEAFILPDDESEGNLPRLLLCGHIYCTSCLESLQCDGVIKCPECEVESTLPEGGVCCLQEESRIIGLIYTAKINKIKSLHSHRLKNRRSEVQSTDVNANTDDVQAAKSEKIKRTVDEALARGAENLAQLEHIHETLKTGVADQEKRERVRLEMEIKLATDKALRAVHKWREMQLSHLMKLEAQFVSTSEAEMCRVVEKLKSLKIAMQMAREVRRVPFLQQHCILDEVLETLQAPVDKNSFDMKGVDKESGSGMSCVFQSESLNQTLTLKVEVSSSKQSEPPPKHHLSDSNRKSPSRHRFPSPRHRQSVGADGLSPSEIRSSPSPRPHRRSSVSHHSPCSDSVDVVIEEIYEESEEFVPSARPPPTGPEMANDKRRNKRKKNTISINRRNVTQWVVVTHVVNPSHFYVQYVAERRESEFLSKKINQFCSKDNCFFSSTDSVETGSLIFVKGKDGLWCRGVVAQIEQNGCRDDAKTCQVSEMSRVRVQLLDSGLTSTITLQSEDGSSEFSLKTVNDRLRKVSEGANVELGHVAPLAVRCSLKDLVPYDLTKGWSKEAQVEFRSVVSSAAVEMRPLGKDGDSLLVDLKKAPMDQTNDLPISVRGYLVFIEVARFYYPVKLNMKQLQYYPPVYPSVNTEHNAVVSHINNPANFYIQLVDNMESLLLSAKLQDCYNATTVAEQDNLNIYCSVVGQACVARFQDKLWYRAKVLAHPGRRQVEVQYVDFGNKEILSVSDLRKIKDEFFALPTMAIRCCLSDVIPLEDQTWSDACTNRFISLAHHKLVTVVATGSVSKSEPLPVKLLESAVDGPQTDIAELLVTEQLARFKHGCDSRSFSPPSDQLAIWDSPLNLSSTSDDVDTQDQNEEDPELQPQLKLPDHLRDIKVRVSHVNSPSSFYVQIAQNDAQLKRICNQVKSECSLTEPQEVTWRVNMFCAALINEVWERGRIVSDVTSDNTVEVMRCDYGNITKLHVISLRPLLPSLIGSLALECTLTDIRPAGGQSTWTATACDLFSYYLMGASAVMTIKELTDERPLPVTLFCSNKMGQFVSIADFLASKGLALRERKPRDSVVQKEPDAQTSATETQPHHDSDDKENLSPCPPLPFPPNSTLIAPKPAPRTVMSVEKVKTSLYRPPELPDLGLIQVTVSAVGEDGLIYTRTQSAERELQQLRDRIHQCMKTLPSQKLYTWKLVRGCAVSGSDMMWYRGQLLEVQGGDVKVQYVDYGLVENIPVVHVYPMLLCDDVPQLCTPCQLHAVNPVGGRWQSDAVVLLRELLLSRCVNMNVLEVPEDPRAPLTAEIFLDSLSLSRILCHHQHASVDRTITATMETSASSPPSVNVLDVWDIDTEGLQVLEEPVPGPFIQPDLPQVGDQFQVRVKHLRTPNELFLWPLEETNMEVDGENLDDALTRVNANISSLPPLSSFSPGGPCLAEYSDGKYYRAKLMKFISVEPIVTVLVQHVDFGSDDTLPVTKLRQAPLELLKFPSQALQVKVAGFRAPSVERQVETEVLPYSPGWSMKAALSMIELLHSNITACVVARHPQLIVHLYDDGGELVHLPLVSRGLAELESDEDELNLDREGSR